MVTSRSTVNREPQLHLISLAGTICDSPDSDAGLSGYCGRAVRDIEVTEPVERTRVAGSETS